MSRCNPSSSPTRTSRSRPSDPRVAAVLRNPLEAGAATRSTDRGALLVHRTRASGLMMAAAMDHVVEVPGRVEVRHRGARGLGAHDGDLRPAARPAAAHREVPGLRMVEPAVAARAARPGRRGASRARATPAGRACSKASASTSTSSGTAPTSRSKATPTASRRCGSGCFTCCRPAPAPSGARSRARGSPAPATTATPSGTPRDSCCRVLTYTAPRRRRRRAALAGVDARPGACASRRTRPGGRELPVAHHPRRGMLGVLAGRHRGMARQRRHRDGVRAVSDRDRRRVAGGGLRAGGARRDGTAVAVARPPRPARRCGTSTASPAPTSTRRWCATTCSPT